MKKIVTIQDISCYGQCSITVALPVLSSFGIETAILPSAILSTHTGGFTGFTCLDLTEEMPAIVNHWEKEHITFDAIYTGYIGDTRQFEIIKSTRRLLKEGGLLIVDPAMADNGTLYAALNEDIVDGMRSIVREADIILPNLTEAAFLLGEEYQQSYSREEIYDILRKLSDMGPDHVILTGVSYENDRIGAVAYEKETDSIIEYFTRRIGKSYHGTGDVFSSVAIAELLNGKEMSEVLKSACEFVVRSIENTLPDKDHVYGVKFESVLAGQRN